MKLLISLIFLMFLNKTVNGQNYSHINENKNQSSERIVGGSFVSSCTQYPSVVRIPRISKEITYPYEPPCAGTILNELWIVTAGSCNLVLGAEVIAGNPMKEAGFVYEQKRNISRVIRHKDFEYQIWQMRPLKRANDIALLKLNSPLAFNAAVTAAKLFPKSFKIKSHKYLATVVGWGSVSKYDLFHETDLRQIDAPYVDERTCRETLLRYHQIKKPPLSDCFGYGKYEGWKGHGPCYGDGGGPLYGTSSGHPPSTMGTEEHRLIGILSYYPCWTWSIGGEEVLGIPSLYTMVRHYYDWMGSTLKAEGYARGIEDLIVPLHAGGTVKKSLGGKVGLVIALLICRWRSL